MKKIYIIDAMGYIFRSFHAIREMSTQLGEPTNALYGFARSVLKLQKDFNPEYLVAVFDGERNEKSRVALYADYKANRSQAPEALLPQFATIEEFTSLLGIPMLRLKEVEADDTIASIARVFEKQDFEVVLCSTDKDLVQLINSKICMLNTFKDNLLIDEKGAEQWYGIPPTQMRDYLALVGDTSDNVPGVPGIGPKGAQELLKEFGTLDHLLEQANLVKGKKGEALKNYRDQALLSRQLVTLNEQLPVPHQIDFYRLRDKDNQKLAAFFQEKEFQSLLQELASPPNRQTPNTAYHLIDTLKALDALVKRLEEAPLLCVDTETTNENPLLAELVGIGVGIEEGQAWYIPLNGPLEKNKVLSSLKPLFQEKPSFGHNIKYDMHVLEKAHIPLGTIAFDTMVASYLLQAEERQHSLDRLALKEFKKVKIPIEDLIGKGKNQTTLLEVNPEKVCQYCCEDVDYTFRLKNLYAKELETRGLNPLFQKIELPLITVLAKMEERGVFVDTNVLKSLSQTLQEELKKLQDHIFNVAGETFNLNSPKQLSDILFNKLGIKAPKKTATGFSTNADVLESLALRYPIAETILNYRTLEKLRSTYIDTLPEQVNPQTGRIHCTFNQSVAATGRLSCQNPNLQNIPVRTELGKEIRAAFRPQKEGWSLLSADYSQIELRLLAHFSQDVKLLDTFHKGKDVHTATAASLFDISESEVTLEMRTRAKAVNFGLIYGQQAWGLSQGLKIDPKEASTFISRYFQKYPQVKDYIEKMKEEARIHKVTKTLWGRERRLPEILSSNPMVRQAQERLAINTPLQGTNADLIKMAMLQIEKALPQKGLRAMMILQIHDELLFELPDSETEILVHTVKEIMENIAPLKVPLVVNVGIGKNWKEC